MRNVLSSVALVLLATPAGLAQTTQVRGADGVLYNETRTHVPKTVLTTEIQTRQETVYKPQINTQYQTYQQSVVSPVTEYRWVSRQKGWWNPFRQPYWTHAIEPVTRWQHLPTTVQVPVTTTNWVPETRTTQVPVASYKTVNIPYAIRVPATTSPGLGPATTRTPQVQVATRPTGGTIGGQRLDAPARWGGRARY